MSRRLLRSSQRFAVIGFMAMPPRGNLVEIAESVALSVGRIIDKWGLK